MPSTWTAVVLTCASKNSSIAYQKELKLRQEKGFIDKECLIICLEDPEKPVGSGGATLNAILVVAETLSARKNYRMTNIDVLKDTHILIMHMGRQYPFDVASKAFSTLPLQSKLSNNLMTNFDLIYNLMTYQVACFDRKSDESRSDPGVYVCSTDMIFFLDKNERIRINNKPICVVSSLLDAKVAQENGIYELDGELVKNIHYMPDNKTLLSLDSSSNNLYNLISGIVYFDHSVAQVLYNLLLFPPLDACSYMGVDSGASPLCLSIFFDILLAGCAGLDKESFVSGSFKTNHRVEKNQMALLRQARSILHSQMKNFSIYNITAPLLSLNNNNNKLIKHVYMNNSTLEHRVALFNDYADFLAINNNSFLDLDIYWSSGVKTLNVHIKDTELRETTSSSSSSNNTFLVNSIITNSSVQLGANVKVVNCRFNASHVSIGENSFVNDLELDRNNNMTIPASVFVQSVKLNIECIKSAVCVNIVFGLEDNLGIGLESTTLSQFRIMNLEWNEFKLRTRISESDLWPHVVGRQTEAKTLLNAKLYPIFHINLSQRELNELSGTFWLDLINHPRSSSGETLINKWRESQRVSLEEIGSMVDLASLFETRRRLFNVVNGHHLVNSVLNKRGIQFGSLIRNAVHDGFAHELLRLFDEAALKHHANDLITLPRIMVFISDVLCEMALGMSSVRSGPNLNQSWQNAFQFIEDGLFSRALTELSKERQNWMHRNDLLIRASRHYEGAMLAFIRQATSSFKFNTGQEARIVSTPIVGQKNYTWVQVDSPARLDLAGAWSDTPPITYECEGGSSVTNVAVLVNGKKPIGSKVRLFKPPDENKNGQQQLFIRIVMQDSADNESNLSSQVVFEFDSVNDFRDYNRPQATACLMKAVCVFTKLIEFDTEESLDQQLRRKLNGHCLELRTWTGLPHGSGLGTSSILAGCVLKAVWYVMGQAVGTESLSYAVLLIEQIMTTNGGWQDQVGGMYAGFKLTTAKNKLPLEMSVTELDLNREFLDDINSRLVLIYTGLTRLAKDLLLNVLRNWYAISPLIYENVQALVANGFRCAKALQSNDIKEFGESITRHRKQKLIMAPGSEPESVTRLIKILEPITYGMAVAGAGGGGFLYALTKEPNQKARIDKLIKEANLNMEIYDAQVAEDGIEISFA